MHMMMIIRWQEAAAAEFIQYNTYCIESPETRTERWRMQLEM